MPGFSDTGQKMSPAKRKALSKNEEEFQLLIKKARKRFNCDENGETNQILSHLKSCHPGLLYADNSQLMLTSHVLSMGHSPMFILNMPDESEAADKEEEAVGGPRLGKLILNSKVSDHRFNKDSFTPFLDEKVSFILALDNG